jgi:carbamoyltransferase
VWLFRHTQGAFLGPEFPQAEIEQRPPRRRRFSVLSDDDLIRRSAEAIAAEKALGWFQGRMEFGPRALGARSILGDARSSAMQSMLNLKIKFRSRSACSPRRVLREQSASGLKSTRILRTCSW